MYDEFIKRLRKRAEAFGYNGWVETASDYEKAAEIIENLSKELIELKLLTCCCGEPLKEES